MAWLYGLARRLFRRSVDLYFLDVQVRGAEELPPEGPVLFASNHPNSLMDTVVLGASVERPIAYLARSGLFRHPLAGALLRGAGAIPLYRRQDGGGTRGNQDAFRAAFERLREGGVIGIFPEGRNAPTRHVREIKTGAARIALGAAAPEFTLPVRIVPVGLNYEARERFLTRVLVRFGEPIEVEDYAAAHRADPQGAARALTSALQERMREVAVHVGDEAQTELVQGIHALYGETLRGELYGEVDVRSAGEKLLRSASGRDSRHADLEARFDTEQWIADALAFSQAREPEAVARLERGFARYERHRHQLRLRADFAERPARTLSSRREAIKLTAYAMFLAPVAAWGLAHNFIPYRLTRRFGLRAPEEAIIAARLLAGGLIFFGAFYAFYGAAIWGGTKSAWAVGAYLASLPAAGFWFLRYARTLGHYAHRILVRTLFRTRRELLRRLLIEREQLVTQIDALRRTYEAELRDRPPKQERKSQRRRSRIH